MSQGQLLLCFGWSEAQVCRVANSPTGSFYNISESIFYHYDIRIASNGGKLIKFLFEINCHLDTVMAVGRDGQMMSGPAL